VAEFLYLTNTGRGDHGIWWATPRLCAIASRLVGSVSCTFRLGMLHPAKLQGGALPTVAALAAAMVAIVTDAAVPTGPKVNAAEVAIRASTPPPPYASPATSVGRNRVTASRNHEVTVWTEQIDIDGDGILDDATFAYDEPNKILFASKSGTFRCKSGGAHGSGDMLIAVNLAGNFRRRPAGSGFWATSINEGECNAPFAGTFGCRFDSDGVDTRCGLVHVDSKIDDIMIVTAAQ
jgi:hypothetical protein